MFHVFVTIHSSYQSISSDTIISHVNVSFAFKSQRIKCESSSACINSNYSHVGKDYSNSISSSIR